MRPWNNIKESKNIADNIMKTTEQLLGSDDYEYICSTDCEDDFELGVLQGYYDGLTDINMVFDVDPVDGLYRLSSGGYLYAYGYFGDGFLYIARVKYNV